MRGEGEMLFMVPVIDAIVRNKTFIVLGKGLVVAKRAVDPGGHRTRMSVVS